MNLRKRLLWACCIIIGFPIVLILATTGAIMYYTVNSINSYYDADSSTYQIITNPIKVLNNSVSDIYDELQNVVIDSPDQLRSESYAVQVNKRLNKKESFLVVLEDEETIYVGNQARYSKVKQLIPKMTIYNTQDDSGLYIDASQPFLFRKLDFTFTDGKEGSIYIITDIQTLLPQVKKSFYNLLICFFGIICFTAFLMSLWIYQGMIKPINVLRAGIYRMKNGDLDYEIKIDSDDDFGELCDDFDDMRRQVKKLMEERIEYEEQMKALISNVSHDLKTPLTAIKGYAEGILDGVADSPEKMDKYLKTICTKASDMTYLVDELSFYSKIDGNKVPYNFEEINLEHYFSDCINDLTLDLEVKNIELYYENNVQSDATIILDAEQIKRVINNIIGNSVKYMDKEKGFIKVILTEDEGWVKIEFKDNGKGVPESDINKIFERFYRSDQSRNSTQGGSGLGLAIAKKIIEDHGGSIWAESTEGEGTSVFIRFEEKNHICKEEDYKIDDSQEKKIKRVKY